jgi:hypothetical protein
MYLYILVAYCIQFVIKKVCYFVMLVNRTIYPLVIGSNPHPENHGGLDLCKNILYICQKMSHLCVIRVNNFSHLQQGIQLEVSSII